VLSSTAGVIPLSAKLRVRGLGKFQAGRKYRLAPQAAAVALVGLTVGWTAVPLVFFLPVVCWMHSTYMVNSVCHDARFGSRLFETREGSRNVWWVGLLALGEGWHNNHHAYPRSARHGIGARQLDLSYLLICLFGSLGLARKVKDFPRRVTLSVNTQAGRVGSLTQRHRDTETQLVEL
jgi:fatty-acid desaturase